MIFNLMLSNIKQEANKTSEYINKFIVNLSDIGL